MKLTQILWTCVAMLLGFLVLTHLGVMLCFLTSHRALPWVVPLALMLAIWMGDRLGQREGLQGRSRWIPIGLSLGLIVLALAIAGRFYGLSWDGQWYQQPAIHSMVEGWDPLRAPMHSFPEDIHLWIRHYAKGFWYMSAAMTATMGRIEYGKFVPWLVLDAAFMAVLAACLDAGMRRGRALALSAVVVLNPVVTLQLMTFMVDGLMICYLAIYVAVICTALRRTSRLVLYVGLCAIVCSINVKLTGLVYLCFITTGVGCYCLWRKRKVLWRFAILNLGAILLGTLVFGYNPYVTNTIHRQHPFYPYMGTQTYPSLADQGQEGIELYETPKNMLGRNRLVRHAMALFGQPGNQPYYDGPNALPMWPFLVPIRKLVVYHTHEARVAGFGPFFSGVLILSLLLTVWLLISSKTRWLLLLAYVTIVASLLVSLHTWWARYGPQMWWIPLLPILAIFWQGRHRLQTKAAWVLVAILMANALLVAAIHLHWEITATRTLHDQLAQLSDSGQEIEVSFKWFGDTFRRRFEDWGIPYQDFRGRPTNNDHELMSVITGYPGTIQYRVRAETPSRQRRSSDSVAGKM